MKKLVLLFTLSTIFSITPFKGYIKHEGYYNTYPYVYAEGQYLNGLMDGEWFFYTDSTKQNLVAKGNFLNGDTSNPSKDGIPRHGRQGFWEHYYTNINHWRHSPTLKNPIRATEYWNDGKLTGRATSYFQDGKIAVECDYNNGKKHGNRKEWYQGGYMYTKLYRNTEYKKGRTISDKIYDYSTNISIISSYLDDIRTDTIYSSNDNKKIMLQKIKNGSYHGDFIAYHINGEVWITGSFFDGKRNGEWKEFSDEGILIAKMKYNQGKVEIPDGYEQKLYNLDGKLIYSYHFSNGVRNGKATEILYNVSNIAHRVELNSGRYSYQGDWDDFYHFKDLKHLLQYDNQTYQIIPNLNPYVKQPQYRIVRNSRFSGFIRLDSRNKNFLKNQIIGTGNYKNNIRVGEWIWKTIGDHNLAITGQYNEKGQPIGEWKEIDPNDDSNLIITQYDTNGQINSVSRKSKTYSRK